MVVFSLDGWHALTLAVQVVLPILINLVTTKVTKNAEKAYLLAFLTVVVTTATGALQAHQAGTLYDLGQGLMDAVGGFLVSIAAYHLGWKPTGLSAKATSVLVTPADFTPVPPVPPAPSSPPALTLVPPTGKHAA